LELTPLQRALTLAPERETQGATRPEQEFFFFRAGGHRFGVPSENVREVVRVPGLTPLPRAPGFVLGVTSHRGEVLPVLDLLRFLGKGEAKLSERTRLFVGISGSFLSALPTDGVVGLRRVPLAEILPVPMGGDPSSEHLLGVVQVDKETWNLLNFNKLLTTARQRAVVR
jgi:purine-binding chemotaxis protein CheW